MQWLDLGSFSDCYIIGRYDAKQDDLSYSLLDSTNPTKGISMKYPSGDVCDKYNGVQRSATIDVECANTPTIVKSATEPSPCQYHLTMQSYYGCPTVSSFPVHLR